jgi:Putative metal-binding motif
VHSAPKAAVGGFVTFRAGWTAPATPGGVNFYVSGVSANGDNSSRGDGGGFGFLSFAYGCTGVMFYRDYDGDGVGGDLSGYTIDCAKPQYYAAIKGDCNDNDDRIKPGAVEVCNKRDDNCDGRVDENLPIVAYYTDGDGDGHGKPGGAMVMDCTPPKGYGVGNDDCDDTKATTYVGAQELCNYVDDNCNGRIDEDARVTCGVGWCRRLGSGCGSSQCTPGEPRVEECNAFDDDCDGVNDNGTDVQLCGDATKTCVQGYCVAKGSLPDGGAGGKPGTGSAGSSGSGAGPGGGALTGGTAGDPGTGGSSIERTHPGCSVVEAPSSASLSVGLVLVALALGARRRSRHSKG